MWDSVNNFIIDAVSSGDPLSCDRIFHIPLSVPNEPTNMNQTASDPRTKNGTAKVENKARAALERFGVKELIAQPIN